MSISEQLKTGYSDICLTDDAPAAYAEFHSLITETDISVDDVIASAVGNTRVLAAIERVRRVETYTRGEPNGNYFAGSGMLVVGSDEGVLLTASYETGESDDPVDKQYPGYQKVGLRKAALGALGVRMGWNHLSVEDRYVAEEETLATLGLTSVDAIPHHLGHAATAGLQGHELVAGATGFLPSNGTAWHMRNRFPKTLERDYARGWVTPWHEGEPSGDEFAGLHDETAASSVLVTLGGRGSIDPVAFSAQADFAIHFSKRNMH